MADFSGDEESAHDHELVLDDELIQDDGPTPREERGRRLRGRGQRSEDALARRPQVRVGDVIAGKYCVERVHQQGALGVTVEAEHLQLGQRVALKLMLADPRLHPEAAGRFLRGARFAVQLRNEHVARVTDVATLDSGAPYMVTEHLSGSDLRGVLRVREWLPVPEAVDYVLQACEALAEAHVMGFVHRNLKLSNLFLTRRPEGHPFIKVLDFCVSEGPLGEAAINMSTTSAVVSSLAYLAPEQIRDPAAVDARADVWALGAILHELLTGAPLYTASSAPGLFAAIAADPATPASHLRPEIPAELESVILRCLEKEREDRWADVGELARRLKPFASAEGRDSVDRVVLILERRARSAKSSRPPALPGAASSRSIVHVGPAAAAVTALSPRARLLGIAVATVGILGCSVGIGAYVAMHNLQAVLASQAAERSVVATLSPALTASQASDSWPASSAGAAPTLVPVAALPVAPPRVALNKPAPRAPDSAVAPAPVKRSASAESSDGNVIAEAKPAPASRARAQELFDGTN